VTHTTFVSTDTLATHLGGDWAIVDCRYDLKDESWGHRQYVQAHVPGAAYASLSHDMAGPATPGNGGRHPLPSPEAMAETFARLGIAPATQVVLYDQDAGQYASRLWWMLHYMGHAAAAVLDGGWTKWIDEGRPTRSGEEHAVRAQFSGSPRSGFRVDASDVEASLGRQDVLLVDARAPQRYRGEHETLDKAAGHIPGAANHFFQQNVAADRTMLPPEQLRAQFERTLGATPADRVVMYCGSGVTACHNLLAMEHAGLHGARLYPGSWSEWSSDPRRPIATDRT
jgi:thiosulfate/3-mercaptopyruvate sulfurtransferase